MPPKARTAAKTSKAANALWGGRYAAGPAAIMAEINASIDVDRRLYAEDIAGSKAHAAMLVRQRIIDAGDGQAIQDGLDRILAEIEAGKFAFRAEHEDIHMNVEARLAELIGPAAGPPPHRALAQRPGRDRFQAVGAQRDRRPRRARRRTCSAP